MPGKSSYLHQPDESSVRLEPESELVAVKLENAESLLRIRMRPRAAIPVDLRPWRATFTLAPANGEPVELAYASHGAEGRWTYVRERGRGAGSDAEALRRRPLAVRDHGRDHRPGSRLCAPRRDHPLRHRRRLPHRPRSHHGVRPAGERRPRLARDSRLADLQPGGAAGRGGSARQDRPRHGRDFVVLGGDPVVDVRAFAGVRYTVRAGRLIYAASAAQGLTVGACRAGGRHRKGTPAHRR